MPTDYTPAVANALEDARAIRVVTDPLAYSSYSSKRWDAKYGAQEIVNEQLALIEGKLARAQYGRQFTCGSGDAVGDPVRLSGNNTVTKALATTTAGAQVIGFIRHKGSLYSASVSNGTTCYLVHYLYVSGLSGGTARGTCYLTDAGGFSATAGTIPKPVGQFLSTTEAWVCSDALRAALGADPGIGTIDFIFGDGISTISTGIKGYIQVDFPCTIVANTVLADQAGSIVIDIWKDTYANFPPLVADTITASAKPTLSAAQKSTDSTLTGWTTAINAGDILAFNVDSASTVRQVTLALKIRRA